MMSVDCAFPAAAQIGESPVWSPAENSLYWVDMMGNQIMRSREGEETRVWELQQNVGAIGLRTAGGVVAALEDGVYTVDLDTGLAALFTPALQDDSVQFNDAKCDRSGRFWAGTTDRREEHPLGSLYRIDPDGRVTGVLDSIITSNGLGWSPDGTTMYHTDTWTYTITAYDFDPATGDIANPRPFAMDTSRPAAPDGLTVDAEGGVWSAKWDGWQVVRYAPDGSIDRVVPVPVARPTSLAFGGEDLDRLYITTARWQLTPSQLEDQPLAGSVLVADPEVRGMPEPLFGG